MATGTILLPILGATLPDGSTNNAAAQMQRTKSSATASSSTSVPHFVQLLFDAATAEHAFWTFRMPVDYASGPVAKIGWGANATTGNAVWSVQLAAVTASDTDTPNEHALGTVNTATTGANATEARRLIETSITLTNADSVAANDWVTVCLRRDAANGSDTLAVDGEVSIFSIEYTTT